MGTFNTYGNKSKKYGGAYPVWLTVSQKERSGGTLDELPPVGTVIRSGSLVSIDGAGGKAKIVPTFELAEKVLDTQTYIKVHAHKSHPVPKVGMNIMKAPTTVGGTGKGATIMDVEHDPVNNIYILTIATGQLGTAAIGDILVEADKADNGAKIVAVPTGLTENDVWIEDGDYAATLASVFHGEIMEDRIQPIPDCIKAVLPQIKFQKGI
ncbi:hypothetical protein CLV62_104125 [Dysgonomonas alginatilytica]|uniref:Uncharacterized protein n=1 Tax=Dysgonomonas alginatilytica TaxID=1605892 RepID=A0A2V3PR44_9BACT|nr:hypothetical protein [Dysgonomonas alginatilytica]PXV66864.1 hypothetical protein CLV62_104125 [Dysgonomonas alginatilytica]